MLRFLSENFTLKVIALATSVMIWYYVNKERNPIITKQVNADVRIAGQPPTGLIVHLRGDTVPVEITGPKSEVDSIGDDDIKTSVNVTAIHAMDRQVAIGELVIPKTAPNVSARKLKPFAQVEVVERKRKRMQIEAKIIGNAPLGRMPLVPRLTPDYADVMGSEADLAKVAHLRVYLDTGRGSVSNEEIPIRAEDKESVEVGPNLVTIDPANTRVDLTFVDAPTARELVVSASISGRPAPPYQVADVVTEPALVTVTGPLDQIMQLSSVQTAEISVEGITADAQREVPLRMPPGLTTRDGVRTVKVTIKVRDASRPRP